jgi:putative copper export protein
VLPADIVALALRGLAFAATLQAAGGPIFLALFGPALTQAELPVRQCALRAAVAGLILVGLHALVEPARMTGELRGMLDPAMHGLLLRSDAGTTLAVRVAGLLLICVGLLASRRPVNTLALIGAFLTVSSFALMGHTVASDWRWLLALLLIIHLLAVAFWFGSLSPLMIVTRREPLVSAGRLVALFSRWAVRLVPLILIAGIAMAAILLQRSLWAFAARKVHTVRRVDAARGGQPLALRAAHCPGSPGGSEAVPVHRACRVVPASRCPDADRSHDLAVLSLNSVMCCSQFLLAFHSRLAHDHRRRAETGKRLLEQVGTDKNRQPDKTRVHEVRQHH